MKKLPQVFLFAASTLMSTNSFADELKLSPEDVINPNKISEICFVFKMEATGDESKKENFCSEFFAIKKTADEIQQYCTSIFLNELYDSLDKKEKTKRKILDAFLNVSNSNKDDDAITCLERVEDIMKRSLIDLTDKYGYRYGITLELKPTPPP